MKNQEKQKQGKPSRDRKEARNAKRYQGGVISLQTVLVVQLITLVSFFGGFIAYRL